MDLNTIDSMVTPRSRQDVGAFQPGDAWLAGGTWLFSEPQPTLRRLVDLAGLGWESLRVSPSGLSIAATCTIATLDAFEPPAAWTAATLIGECCRAFLASFKIWNMATVGGNLCIALPAGPMISLCAALDAECLIWTPDGGERRLSVLDFVTGPQTNALKAGELLRSIEIPDATLRRHFAFRRISLTPLGRSGALLVGVLAIDGRFDLTVTAATRRPIRLAFEERPTVAALRAHIEAAIPLAFYYDDVHGRPDWRRHMTLEFAEEILTELTNRQA